jgi:hypothetical protein
MNLSLVFNHKAKTRLLAQLTLFENIEQDEEPETEEKESKSTVDGGSKSIRTGFHPTV